MGSVLGWAAETYGRTAVKAVHYVGEDRWQVTIQPDGAARESLVVKPDGHGGYAEVNGVVETTGPVVDGFDSDDAAHELRDWLDV